VFVIVNVHLYQVIHKASVTRFIDGLLSIKGENLREYSTIFLVPPDIRMSIAVFEGSQTSSPACPSDNSSMSMERWWNEVGLLGEMSVPLSLCLPTIFTTDMKQLIPSVLV
jgi:hypothetical protein